ncbi:MAG: hypothetical protein A4S08_12490 [Proteobacteria bacterium SG_bin4]|nr:MAG: hypothetical protein A4S08_12490 [Proteobacteria bacterium SG_bin4]
MVNHLETWEILLIALLIAAPVLLFGAVELIGRANRRKAQKIAQRNKVAELEARRGARDARR